MPEIRLQNSIIESTSDVRYLHLRVRRVHAHVYGARETAVGCDSLRLTYFTTKSSFIFRIVGIKEKKRETGEMIPGRAATTGASLLRDRGKIHGLTDKS